DGHDGGCGTGYITDAGAADQRIAGDGGPVGRTGCALSARLGAGGRQSRCERFGPHAPEPGVCDLYLRLHWATEGDIGGAPQPIQLPGACGGGVPAGIGWSGGELAAVL